MDVHFFLFGLEVIYLAQKYCDAGKYFGRIKRSHESWHCFYLAFLWILFSSSSIIYYHCCSMLLFFFTSFYHRNIREWRWPEWLFTWEKNFPFSTSHNGMIIFIVFFSIRRNASRVETNLKHSIHPNWSFAVFISIFCWQLFAFS